MRKIALSILTTLAALATFAPTASMAQFYDVYSSHPSYTAVEFLRARGIANGYSGNSYRPNNSMTRGDFVAMVVRATGARNSYSYKGTTCYSDLRQKAYADEICYAKGKGWLRGLDITTGKFRPSAKISAAEATKITVAAFDVPNIYDGLAATGRITRGEAAQLVYEVMGDAGFQYTYTNTNASNYYSASALNASNIQVPAGYPAPWRP